jgi:hypothetical protein
MANTSQGFTDYNAVSQDIERRRKYAEMLQQQSMSPIEQQTAGGWVVPTSWTQGLAKVLQSYTARKGQEAATKEQRDLYGRLQTDQSGDVQRLVSALRGTPAQEAMSSPGAEIMGSGPDIPGRPATTGAESLQLALPQMRTPMGQQLGLSYLTEQLKNKPESAFGKVDAKDYTPESVRSFMAGGAKNFSVLVPVRKMEFIDTGGGHQAVNPYSTAPGQVITSSMRPGEQARLDWDKYQFGNVSQADRLKLANEGAGLGIRRAELAFNTGAAPMGGGAAIPPNAPMPMGGSVMSQPPAAPVAPSPSPAAPIAPAGPRIAPQGAATQGAPQVPGLTPKSAQEVAKARAEMEGKRAFNMQNIVPVIQEAEMILKGKAGKPVGGVPTASPIPTDSGVGALVDWGASLVGKSTKGAEQADRLKALGGSLTAAMPRMEGPQSDKDVQLYREMAAQIGDNTLPVERRLAALDTVKRIFAKYPQQSQPGQSPQPSQEGGWKDL